MPTYTVKVFSFSGPSNIVKWISVNLVGTEGESGWTWFTGMRRFFSGRESTVTLTCAEALGDLVAVDLQKQQLPLTLESQWFVEKVEVTSSDGKVFKFPVYHWLKRSKVYSFCEGKALKASEQHPAVKYTCKMELERRAQKYCWTEYRKGLPHCMMGDSISDLPSEVHFSFTKFKDFFVPALSRQVMKGILSWFTSEESWKDFGAIEEGLSGQIRPPVSEYVQQHWREDAFFGYQFLNAVNPVKICRCSSLPTDLQVSDHMVTLEGGAKLSDEMRKGNIFFCDYKTLDGVETNKVDHEEEFLAAPLVLFHKTPTDDLKPVAIQLKQDPSQNNPVFLPSDSEYDWLLAKTYVRSADFSEHQLNTHLLRTHLLAEVFAVSLLRNTAKVHPLHKLLLPHTRYTLQINLLARKRLISEDGSFPTFSASNEKGMTTIIRRSLSVLKYKSLCIKDDIADRGVESMPNYYYRDDGFKLWDIIEKFVEGVLTHYYKSDEEVKGDTELQNYIQDIFEHGFHSKEDSGIPQTFKTVAEVVKFSTMVIFTCSAQHAAVNNGQSDYGSWMPNTPTTLLRAPPTTKGTATEETLLQTLPGRTITDNAVSVMRLLSTPSTDFVALGQFPQELFTEDVPCQLMQKFRDDLQKLDEEINHRNENLPLPYVYLKPKLMENSVSI